MADETSIRIDKWLWFARFFKSRTLAAKLCASGRLRLGGRIVEKPHHGVKVSDVLTFPSGDAIRIVRVLALGIRRGTAPEARTLFEDLSPPRPERQPAVAAREPGAGRPTKADRRAIDRLTDEE